MAFSTARVGCFSNSSAYVEQDGCVAGETTEDDVGCVDDDPFPLDVVGLGRICARHNSAAFIDRVRCS